MARIMAIDYGRKRSGIAVTDPLQIIANKLTTVRTHDIFDFLDDYFIKEEVEELVVGYPLTMNNEASESIRYINPFLKQFQKRYPGIKLELADERFTSKMAFQTMIDAGIKQKERRNKELIDAVSASIILQWHMEHKRNKRI
jgi:putative Holliday junction resolvase